jgi:beta-glucosidase
VSLEAGQSQTVTFKLRREDLSFIGADNKPVVEPGEFEVRIGGLTQKFTVK